MSSAPEIHRAMWDAIAAGDPDGVRALLHDDYVYRGWDGVEHDAQHKLAVVRIYTTAFPDNAFTVEHHHQPSDDVSILELRARGTHEGKLMGLAPTGESIDVVGCNVIEARDGRIHRERDYWDNLTIIEQVGAALAPD